MQIRDVEAGFSSTSAPENDNDYVLESCVDGHEKTIGEQHARDRLALFIGKRHKRGRGFGVSVLADKSANSCGLWSLNGTVIAPRANKPWQEKPSADGERRR